jgi:hypothetical protein
VHVEGTKRFFALVLEPYKPKKGYNRTPLKINVSEINSTDPSSKWLLPTKTFSAPLTSAQVCRLSPAAKATWSPMPK